MALREGRDPGSVKGLAIRQGNDVFLYTGHGDYVKVSPKHKNRSTE